MIELRRLWSMLVVVRESAAAPPQVSSLPLEALERTEEERIVSKRDVGE